MRYWKFFVYLKIYDYFKNIVEEDISQEFRLKNKDETKNYLIEEMNRNELMSKKHKNVCATLNYIEDFLILDSTITWCCSVSGFPSLVSIPKEITSSAKWLNICVITVVIKKIWKEAW